MNGVGVSRNIDLAQKDVLAKFFNKYAAYSGQHV